MIETPLTVRDYRVAWSNYNDYAFVWLKRFTFSRGNLIRFGLYSAVMLVMTVIPALGFIGADSIDINGNPIERQFRYLMVLSSVIGSVVFGAALAFVVGPALAYISLLGVYIFGRVSRKTGTLTLSSEGVIKTGSQAPTLWTAVHHVRQTARTILIFTSTSSALIVPRSAFSSPDAADAFYSAAHTAWLNAKR